MFFTRVTFCIAISSGCFFSCKHAHSLSSPFGVAMAEDLPKSGFVITNQAVQIPVYEVASVDVSNSTVRLESAGGRDLISGDAVVELKLKVEGNLCHGKVKDTFFIINSSTQELRLYYYMETNPYGEALGCPSNSLTSEVMVPMRISLFEVGKREHKMNFTVLVTDPLDDEQKRQEVRLLWTEKTGFLATLP